MLFIQLTVEGTTFTLLILKEKLLVSRVLNLTKFVFQNTALELHILPFALKTILMLYPQRHISLRLSRLTTKVVF